MRKRSRAVLDVSLSTAQSRFMYVENVVTSNTPDPSEQVRERVRQLGLRVAGFTNQLHLEPRQSLGLQEIVNEPPVGGERATVSLSYTVWRSPSDRDATVNLARTGSEVPVVPDEMLMAGRPAWLVREAHLMQYPMLWEAVRTHTFAAGAKVDLSELIREHVQDVLNGRFPELHASPDWSQIRSDADITVDGVGRGGLVFDASDKILGLAAELSDGCALTCVVDRDFLPLLDMAFVSRAFSVG